MYFYNISYCDAHTGSSDHILIHSEKFTEEQIQEFVREIWKQEGLGDCPFWRVFPDITKGLIDEYGFRYIELTVDMEYEDDDRLDGVIMEK